MLANPVRMDSELSFDVVSGVDDPATVSLHDAAGRRRWSRTLPELPAGFMRVRTGQIVDADLRLTPGIYFLRVRQGDGVATARLVLVR